VSAPDVIVGWLQNDYGQLGRPAEAIAHALVRSPRAGKVAYLEPFVPNPRLAEPELGAREDRGLLVLAGRGTPPVGGHEIGAGVVSLAGMTDPVLLNFGVSPANWWLHYELAPVCGRTVLVTHDKLALWDAVGAARPRLERTREHLIACSDVVCGLSEGAIDDVDDGIYVGHGVDEAWLADDIDQRPEPADLAAIPHPRAVYVGAMSMRFEIGAVRALADSGVEVVLIGLAPPPELVALAQTHPHVHLVGERSPELTPGYLLHSDVGIVPHTDEPFTYSMEPHKAYNYAAAGLPTVTLHTAHAPALDGMLTATSSIPEFVAGVRAALDAGRLSQAEVAQARTLSWDRVADALLDAAVGAPAGVPA
jgi:Glycosyl transferases group 1